MLQLEIQFSPKTKMIRKCNFHFLFITVPRQFYTQCVNLHTVCKITHMIKVCKNLKCCPVSLLIVINAFVIVFVFVFLWSRHVSSSLYSNVSEDKSLLNCSLKVFSCLFWTCHAPLSLCLNVSE